MLRGVVRGCTSGTSKELVVSNHNLTFVPVVMDLLNTTKEREGKVGVPQALVISRKARSKRQSELGVPYSQQMVSKIENGERTIADDMAPHFARALDHPAMFFELARELTGGFGPAWLNGTNVDLHRSSVREKCVEELDEAIQEIEKFRSAKPPHAEGDAERRRRKDHLLQVMDAVQAAYMYIGIQCEEYGFSLLQLSQEHFNKLRSLRYVEPESLIK